jgi:hypothetical protein
MQTLKPTASKTFIAVKSKHLLPNFARRILAARRAEIDAVMILEMVIDHPHRILVPGPQLAKAFLASEGKLGIFAETFFRRCHNPIRLSQ